MSPVLAPVKRRTVRRRVVASRRTRAADGHRYNRPVPTLAAPPSAGVGRAPQGDAGEAPGVSSRRRSWRATACPSQPGEIATRRRRRERPPSGSAGTVVVKAQVLVGGRGKAGGVKLAATPDEAERHARRDPRHGDQGRHGADRAGGAGRRDREGVLPRPDPRPRRPGGHRHRQRRGRGRDRGDGAARTPRRSCVFRSTRCSASRSTKCDGRLFPGHPGALRKEFARSARAAPRHSSSPMPTWPRSTPGPDRGRRACWRSTPRSCSTSRRSSGIPTSRRCATSARRSPPRSRHARPGINFIKLDGSIGCMVNGAGLAMTTMDLVKLAGGEPANFLDIGGGAKAERVAAAFRIILDDPNVRAILINIFGGITRGDEVAHGIVEARASLGRQVPMVVRIVGTNADEAAGSCARANLITADSLDDAAAQGRGRGSRHRHEHPGRSQTPPAGAGHHRARGRVPFASDARLRHRHRGRRHAGQGRPVGGRRAGPGLRHGRRCGRRDRSQCVLHLRARALRAGRHPRGGGRPASRSSSASPRGSPRSTWCASTHVLARAGVPADRPELPRRDDGRRGQGRASSRATSIGRARSGWSAAPAR